jgi:hypothetical protein
VFLRRAFCGIASDNKLKLYELVYTIEASILKSFFPFT